MYPSWTDVQTYMAGMNLPARSPSDCAQGVWEAVACWERETGYQPFQAAGNSFTVDPPVNGLLKFATPILQLSDLRYQGNPLVNGQDYRMIGDGTRTWAIRFLKPFAKPFVPQSIFVSGTFGYTVEADNHVYQCILRRAIVNLVERDVQARLATGVEQWTQGDESVSYSAATLDEIGGWKKCPAGQEDSFGGATYAYRNMGAYY